MFGSSFGQPQPAATNSFGFGQSAAAPAAGFGAPTSSPFGATNPTSTTTASPFGQPAAQATPATASPFGGSATTSPFGGGLNTGLNNSMSLMSSNSGAAGTTKVPWSTYEEKDKDPRLNNNKLERFYAINMMPQYQTNSLHELRLQDYENNVKGPTNASTTGFGFGQSASGAATSSPFGTPANSLSSPFGQTPSAFGQSAGAPAPAFGTAANSTNAFGQTAAVPGSAFGGSSAFGNSTATPQGSTGFGFGSSTNQNTSGSGLFGQSNPSATSSFGAKPASGAFGQPSTGSTGFGFGGASATPNNAFGAAATPQTSLFGNTTANAGTAASTPFGQAKPSLFGGTPNQPSNPQSSGLFGQSNAANSTGLFGNTNTNQNNTGTGLFGQNNQPSASGFGSTFGQPSQPNNSATPFGQNTSGGAFGQPAAGGTSGFGFGATQNKPAAPSLFGQPATPANSAFGSTNTGAANSGGGLFGAKPATGAFGQPAAGNTGTSSFGFQNTAANTGNTAFGQKPAFSAANNTGTSGTGVFGSTNASTGNTGTGLFGNANNPNNTSGGLFGGANNTQTNNSTGFANNTGGLFGGANNANNNAGSNPGSGLFGGASNGANNNQTSTGLFNKPAGGTGLFGQSNISTGSGLFNQGNQSNGGTLGQSAFGQANNNGNNNTNAQSGGLFGNKMGGGLFGNASAGNNNVAAGSGGLFGNNNSNSNASALGAQPPGTAGSSFLRGSAQGPVGPVASIDSNAYLSSPLFANIRPSNDAADTLAPSAQPRQKSSNFKAPSGVLLAQIMQPRSLPAGRRLSEPRSIAGPTSKDQISKQPENKEMPTIKTNATKDSVKLNKFRNAIFSNHTDDLILDSAAFDFAGRRHLQLISAGSSDTPSKSSNGSPAVLSANGEEFEILSPSGSPYDADDEDYITARQLNADGSVAVDNSIADASLNGPGNTSLAATANSTTHAVSNNGNENLADDLAEEEDLSSVDEDVPDNEIVDKNGYWISPSKQKLLNITVRETRGVRDFRVGQRTHGFVEFLDPVDLSRFSDASSQICGRLIVFSDRSFCLYPNESERPPVGQGFNVKHRVTLYNIFPHSRETQEPIKDGEHPIAKKFLKRLKSQPGFVSWSPQMGTWTFEVDPSKPTNSNIGR